MPQVVAAGVINWWAVAYYAVVIAYSAYEANRQKKAARQRAKDAYNESLQDRLNMVSSAYGSRSRLYGECRNVDGVVFKAAHGASSEFYLLVVALAGHECDSIPKVYFNDQELELESDGAGGWWVWTRPFRRTPAVTVSATMSIVGTTATVTLPYSPIDGSVNCVGTYIDIDTGSHVYTPSVVGNVVTVTGVGPEELGMECHYQYSQDLPKARIWKYLGTDSQDIGSDLLASRFPDLINTGSNDDRFAGMCCLVVELQYDQDAFPTGVPNVTGLVRGAKCYDPRTGLTEWTQNPAIIARDWSLYAYGGGCSESEIVEAAFLAAANACDVSTDFETDDGTETRPLYQCDIVCKLDAPPDQGWLNEIVESMAGKHGWAGGALTLVAGVYRSPVATITEDWISNAAEISVVKDAPLSEMVNVYLPTIANADAPVSEDDTGATAAYAMAAMPEVRSEAYIEADGRELPREVSLGGVSHNVHAQHVCGVFMRDARYAMTLRLPCKMHAWRLELFDVVYVVLPIFGLDAQEFEVIGWEFEADKGIMLTLKRIDASIFDPNANFALPNASLNTSLVLPWIVELVAGLAITSGTSDLQDGTPQSRVNVSWDAAVSESVRQSGKVEIQYTIANGALPDEAWASWPEEGTATSTVIPGLRAGHLYLFRARFINTLRVRGEWCVMQLHRVASVELVGTTLMALNSITDEFTQDAATISQHGFDNYIEYTAVVDCVATVNVEAIATADGDVGPTGAVYNPRMSFGAAILTTASVAVASAVKTTRYTTIGNAPAEVRLTSMLQYEMPAGATWRFGISAVGDFFPDLNWNFAHATTHLKVNKR